MICIIFLILFVHLTRPIFYTYFIREVVYDDEGNLLDENRCY
jgi:hypothetical protein